MLNGWLGCAELWNILPKTFREESQQWATDIWDGEGGNRINQLC